MNLWPVSFDDFGLLARIVLVLYDETENVVTQKRKILVSARDTVVIVGHL